MIAKTRSLLLGGLLCAVLHSVPVAHGQSIGQWDFEAGDLGQSSGGTLGDLTFIDGPTGLTPGLTLFGTTTAFGIPNIGGQAAKVMQFTNGPVGTGYLMPTPSGNGGGSQLNNYTMIYDVLYTSNSIFRPLLQNDDGVFDHILSFLAIGANNSLQATNTAGTALPSAFAGTILPNTWYRAGFVVNQAAGEIDLYINGVRSGVLSGIGGFKNLDNPYSLLANSYVPVLSSFVTNAPGFVNSMQLRDVALNSGQMLALGGPSAAGIPIVIPPVATFINARTPDIGAVDVHPNPQLHVELNQGDTTLDLATVALSVDGTVVAASVAGPDGNGVVTLDYPVTDLLSPLSAHTLKLVYRDSFSMPNFVTNSWSFTIANYQTAYLPAAPVYSENFDLVPEGGLPAGWTVTNRTTTETAGLNLDDTASDSYKDWVVIEMNHYAAVYHDTQTYKSPGQPTVSGNRRLELPPIALNGELIPSLASGNLITAESDQRDDNQVQVLFTPDFDLTAKTNVYLSFYHINEQNQENICSVEYSTDQGVTWEPMLYMFDDGTTDGDGSDIVTNSTTHQIDVFATFGMARSDQAYGLAFSNFIGAAVSTNLIPFIRPCRNDDTVQQKRIEILRAAKADGQSHVRFRFGQAGTASWFFAMDNFAIYTINTPVITAQPVSLTVDAGTLAMFSVGASGNPPLNYQWQFNGVNILNATNSAYTISNALPANAGQYRVVVSNNDGPTTSSPANLAVNTTPVITTQIVGEVADVNGSVTFTPSATGGRPLTYLWFFNGALFKAATTNILTLGGLQASNAGTYTFAVTNVYGAVTSSPASIKLYSGTLTNQLVVHLPFNGDFTDTSGRTNNGAYQNNGATGSPTPTFAPGKLGQAFQFGNLKDGSKYEYATLGYPVDLQFGDTNDFTVSMWVNYTNTTDDPAFISNKDWNSSDYPGWGIFTQSGGNFRLNVTGPNASADKFSVSPSAVIRDGTWHNLVVSFVRAPFLQSAYVYSYVDGVLVNKTPMSVAGTIDTASLPFTNHQSPAKTPPPLQSAFAVNIGEDGTGVYTDNGSAGNMNALIDDLGIWRRALTANEARGIYNSGLAGKDLSQAVSVVKLDIKIMGANANLSWIGSPGVKLQTATSLNPANWVDVPGTTGANSASVPVSGNAAYFRLTQ